MAEKNKLDGAKKALEAIRKTHGSDSIMFLNQRPSKIDFISTQSIALDKALGIGGIPRGRVIEIYGPESSGKTTLAMHIIAEAQQKGGVAAIIDAEHAFDPTYARNLGIDVDNLIISQPDHGEQGLEIADTLIKSGSLDVIVIDSVAALVPKAELDGEIGDSRMGLHARLMSQALRKLTGSISKTNTVLIFINQLREKIGVMFGSPEVTTGGNALKFYASIRLDVRRTGQVKDADSAVVANNIKVKVIKNKVAPPFKQAEFTIAFGIGIDRFTETLNLALESNIIQKAGSWFSYNGMKLGQGQNSVLDKFKVDNAFYTDIRNQVIAKFNVEEFTPNKEEIEDSSLDEE